MPYASKRKEVMTLKRMKVVTTRKTTKKRLTETKMRKEVCIKLY